jgi:hypothetical protein
MAWVRGLQRFSRAAIRSLSDEDVEKLTDKDYFFFGERVSSWEDTRGDGSKRE